MKKFRFSKGTYDGIPDDYTYATKMAYVPIIFLQLVLSCFADSRPQTRQALKEKKMVSSYLAYSQ